MVEKRLWRGTKRSIVRRALLRLAAAAVLASAACVAERAAATAPRTFASSGLVARPTAPGAGRADPLQGYGLGVAAVAALTSAQAMQGTPQIQAGYGYPDPDAARAR